jgi:hypothetical protein
MNYRVVVLAGSRSCPRDLLTGDPAQTFDSNGFLNDNGVDIRRLSFASGRSTICAYELVTETLDASKVIRIRPGRDRLQLTPRGRLATQEATCASWRRATSVAMATLRFPTPPTSTSGR